MVVNDRTNSSRQLAARWSTATGVPMSALSILRSLLHHGLCARLPLYRIPSRQNIDGASDHDGRIRVKRYAGERCLPECVIERHSGLTPGVMQDNASPQVAKTVRDLCSAQHMKLPSWPTFSLDMSLIEHVWGLVGRRLARDPRPAASKDELLLQIQAT
ncbi:hypothetical protein TNCV_2370551 [Trichonephila clavipes]|nr:hypothetical protein TNCV_2370551 [Trichonephila clavipes]